MRFLAEPMIEDGKLLVRRSIGARLRRLARRLATLKRRGLMSASRLLSDVSAKALNSTEDAQLKT
jgi:hypothetical protein